VSFWATFSPVEWPIHGMHAAANSEWLSPVCCYCVPAGLGRRFAIASPIRPGLPPWPRAASGRPSAVSCRPFPCRLMPAFGRPSASLIDRPRFAPFVWLRLRSSSCRPFPASVDSTYRYSSPALTWHFFCQFSLKNKPSVPRNHSILKSHCPNFILFNYFIHLFNIKIVHVVHKNTKEKANEMKKYTVIPNTKYKVCYTSTNPYITTQLPDKSLMTQNYHQSAYTTRL